MSSSSPCWALAQASQLRFPPKTRRWLVRLHAAMAQAWAPSTKDATGAADAVGALVVEPGKQERRYCCCRTFPGRWAFPEDTSARTAAPDQRAGARESACTRGQSSASTLAA